MQRLRILIGLHHVTLGGDTINAVELAAELRRRGHEATLFTCTNSDEAPEDAPLVGIALSRGVPVRTLGRPTNMRARVRLVRELARLARTEHVDIVHSFGHQDTSVAFVGAHGLCGIPLVVNDYQMELTRGLPRRVPLVVGTQEVLHQAMETRPGPTHLVVPPVDTDANRPGAADGVAFRASLGIEPDVVVLVMVSRFNRSMKSEGLTAAVDAMSLLDDPAARLVLVGDGAARQDVATCAAKVNADLGRDAVLLTGWMNDARPAYAAADIVLGMGHSGLRGMAFAKPLVILGERGFCLPVTPETLDHVDQHGVHGVGAGEPMAPAVAHHISELLRDSRCRKSLGEFGRRVVVERYSLRAATDRLELIYAMAARKRSWASWVRDAGYMSAVYGPAKLRRLLT